MIVHNNGQGNACLSLEGLLLFLSATLQQMVNMLQINVKGRRHFLYTVPEDKLLVMKNT